MRWFLLMFVGAFALAQAQSECKATFAVIVKDELNNLQQGFTPKTLEWFQKKMAKKYPDVCYATGARPLVFFISGQPAVYHGVETVSNSGTVSENGTKVADVNVDQAVPYEVEYRKLYLSIETENEKDDWVVRHNFQGKTLHDTYYGICTHNCHPEQKLFEEAIKWLHDGGLNDPMQTTLQK